MIKLLLMVLIEGHAWFNKHLQQQVNSLFDP